MHKTPITQLHDDKIKEIIANEAQLPSLKTKLHTLEERVGCCNIGIVERKEKSIQIRQVNKEILLISNMRMRYHLDCGYLMNKYMETKKKPKTTRLSLDMLGRKEHNPNTIGKNDTYHLFRSTIDPNYVLVDECTANDENYCNDCKCFRIVLVGESTMVCPKCSSQITTTQKPTQPPTNNPSAESKAYGYSRLSHFSSCLNNIQGKGNPNIPHYVIKTVENEIRRERKEGCLGKLTEKDVMRYLRKHKHNRFYAHKTKILWIVTRIRPPQTTEEMDHNLLSMFMATQETLSLYNCNSHNFPSYVYILYKFCQLLGYNGFLQKLQQQLPKGNGVINKYDSTWKKVCEVRHWKFIKT